MILWEWYDGCTSLLSSQNRKKKEEFYAVYLTCVIRYVLYFPEMRQILVDSVLLELVGDPSSLGHHSLNSLNNGE
jgi:hypothetical protein